MVAQEKERLERSVSIDSVSTAPSRGLEKSVDGNETEADGPQASNAGLQMAERIRESLSAEEASIDNDESEAESESGAKDDEASEASREATADKRDSVDEEIMIVAGVPPETSADLRELKPIANARPDPTIQFPELSSSPSLATRFKNQATKTVSLPAVPNASNIASTAPEAETEVSSAL